jgi:osmotically-inducible protein OsmY
MFVLSPVLAATGTLDDMELRSNVEAGIRGTAATAGLHLKIQVIDRVAIPEGIVRDLNQADEVAALAARVRGIVAVDRSRLKLEFAGPGDELLASQVTRTLFGSPRYSASAITITVEHGIVTLHGAIENASWRREIRTVLGEIEGVVDVLDFLESPETPDARIQKALDARFSARAVPHFPGRVHAVVKDGVVGLDGHVPCLRDKQIVERDSFGINGVRRVENRLELGSNQSVQVIDP